MSDSKQPTSDIEALASKAQAMLARVKASADPLVTTGSTLDASKTLDPLDERESTTDSASEPLGQAASTETPVEDTSSEAETTDADLHEETDAESSEESLVDLADEVETSTLDIDDAEMDINDIDVNELDTVADLESVEDLDPVEPLEALEDLKPIEPLEPLAPLEPLETTTTETLDDLEALEPLEPAEALEPLEPISTEIDVDDVGTNDADIEIDTVDADTDAEIEPDTTDADSNDFGASTPLITTPGDADDLDVAWPELETNVPENFGDTSIDSTDVVDETFFEGGRVSAELDESADDDGPIGLSRTEDEEPSITGLGLDDDGSFDNLEFRDVMEEEPESTAASEAEFAAAYESAVGEGLPESPDQNTGLLPVSSVDGDVSDLFDAEEPTAVPPRKRPLNPLLLLLILVPLLVLVFFGDRIFDRGADSAEVETDTTEPVELDETEPVDTTEAPTTTATPDTTAAPDTTETPTTVAQAQTAWDLLGEDSNTGNFTNLAAGFGLQELLEGRTNADTTDFTVFAPSDSALASLTPEQLGVLTADPDAASTLIDYHIIEERLNAAELAEGETLQTRSGLPIEVTLVGDDIVLNGSVVLPEEALESESGTVFVIGSVLQPPTVNEALNLGNIQFETLSNLLTPAGIAELDKAVEFFNENPDVSATIEGHTDTDGSPDGNQRLSDRRAQAVVDYLVSQGVDPSRLVAQGFGETQPIIVDGVEDKEASRRIEIVPQ